MIVLEYIAMVIMKIFRWFSLANVLIFLPQFKKQIPWEKYLAKLDPIDRKNLENILQRLQEFSRVQDLPFAVVAVGSVLNPENRIRKGEPAEGYKDIDLVLVPLLPEDTLTTCSQPISYAKQCLAAFLQAQPEVETKPVQTNGQEAQVPVDHFWHDSLYYVINHFWCLFFESGVVMDIFVQYITKDFRHYVKKENSRLTSQTFSYCIIR